MLNKKLKATSPGVRHQVLTEKNKLCKNSGFLKKFTLRVKKTGGRSCSDGHITSWHRGGGNKKRLIKVSKLESQTFCICVAVVYSSMRSAFISVNFNLITLKFNFNVHTDEQCVGGLLESGLNNKLITQKPGSVLLLSAVYAGAIVSSVHKQNKSVFAKSAGTYCQIVQKHKNSAKLKLPSGKIVELDNICTATLGSVSNKNHSSCVIGKAGKRRYNSKRSVVRGVAMNPVDHPHGGRTNGGRPSVSPWGKLTKGVPTRKK
jgi:large subunit ribosomal protein L2